MAQSLKSKIRKLSEAYNISAIIQTAEEVMYEIHDQAVWDAMSTDQKTQWFYDQCKKYNLTTKQISNQIKVVELPEIGQHKGTRAYFTVFLPRQEGITNKRMSEWRLEIGGAYITPNNGGIWMTNPGLKGKERQIAEVMKLNKEGM